ncbi:MAG: hypothetical protein WBM98_15910 [Maribacter sp.]|uniref:hypothetical protein n=1 Tax=Maribacter sp. TaxID=1897614 RepID=UPI003C7719D8
MENSYDLNGIRALMIRAAHGLGMSIEEELAQTEAALEVTGSTKSKIEYALAHYKNMGIEVS